MLDERPILQQGPVSIPSTPSNEKVILDDTLEHVNGNIKQFDVAVSIAAGHADDDEVDRLEDLRLRRKLDLHLLPLLFFVFCIQFVDKGSLSASAILGIREDNHLTTNEYNNLGSAFYIGYLIFAWPQNIALQRLPVGKWITFNLFLWCLFLGLHPACKNYGGLFALRFLLGASEGCMSSGLMIITSMFYTRTEIGERLGWTFSCAGIAAIINGFLSFGVYHADRNAHPNPWQWLFIACTLLTVFILVMFYFFFPDNPMTAWFLTEEEKVRVVKRVRANQNGIETKVWKKHQFIEAITDVKTWIFFFWAGIADLIGGVGIQYSIQINLFGFSVLETTLLGIPYGAAQVIYIVFACYLLRRFPNSRMWISVFCWIPAVIGGIVQISLPFRFRVGHLIAIFLTNTSGVAPVLMMSWVTSAVSGHTKKTTVSGIFFIGYALGQTMGPQFWKQQYRPKNVVPWAITLGSHLIGIALTVLLYLVLRAENNRRDALKAEALSTGKGLEKFEDFAYLETTDESGNLIKTKVEKAFLDMTDKENLAFRYVL